MARWTAKDTAEKGYKLVGKLGTGVRSARLAAKISRENSKPGRKKVRDVGAVVGAIGRKKYGAHKMAQWSAAGRKRNK